MDFSSEQRLGQLSGLEEFIKKSKEQLGSVMKTLGWSREELLKEEPKMVHCPLNPEHRMPEASLQSHLETCTLHQEGYKSDDEFLPPPEFSTSRSVLIDEHILQTVLKRSTNQQGTTGLGCLRPPRTSERLLTDFTPAERSALHSYVIATRPKDAETTFTLEDLHMPVPEENKQSRFKSKLELLAEQRDAKRRRQNHKKVHTSRKTHTEVLREVIRNQMEYLVSHHVERSSDL